MVPKHGNSDASNSDIFLLCLVLKLCHNYVCIGKNIAYIGFGTVHDLRQPGRRGGGLR